MERLVGLGAALLFLGGTGCGGSGTTDTETAMHFDGGPDGAVEVILDAGGDAATPPDGTAACPAGICNYQTGSGCSGATPACLPGSGSTAGTFSPVCGPAGAGQTGSTCGATTDCAAGYFCAEGQCHKLCCGGDWSGCDSPSQHCIEALEYSDGDGGGIATGAMLCYPIDTCDALTPASCTKAGTACLVADATGVTACLAPGAGGTGEPCPCQGGFVCLNQPGATPTCTRLCKAVEGGAPPYCQEGEGVCTHYTRDPAGVGECTPQ